MVPYFADDAVFVTPFGKRCSGKPEIEAGFEQVFKMMPGATVTVFFDDAFVRMLSSDLGLYESNIEYHPVGAPPVKGFVAVLVKKIDGKWRILHLNPKIIPPQK